MIPLVLTLTAVVGYICGGVNMEILVSKYLLHRDIRREGNRQPGWRNFVRVFGSGAAALVVVGDCLKALPAALLGYYLTAGHGVSQAGALFGGFCTLLGHCYPVRFGYRGGKGIAPFLATLWVADWRMGLIGTLMFVVMVVFTRYLAVSGLVACVLGALMSYVFVDAESLRGLAGAMALLGAALVLVRHIPNLRRLAQGKEPKIKWGRRPERRLEDDFF